jgi:integrase
VKKSTAARRHGTWRTFYRWMEEDRGWIADSPFRFGFNLTQRDDARPKYLSASQAQALLAAAESDPAAAFLVRLGLQAGLKPSEIPRLKVRDLDDGENLVTIRDQHRRSRAVPVQPDLFTAYDAFVEEVLDGVRPDPGEKAVPRTVRWMEMRLAQAARQVEDTVGFAPTFQTLRWTRAVLDLRNGVPPDRLRLKLGYSKQGWAMHAWPALKRAVPHASEGRMA